MSGRVIILLMGSLLCGYVVSGQVSVPRMDTILFGIRVPYFLLGDSIVGKGDSLHRGAHDTSGMGGRGSTSDRVADIERATVHPAFLQFTGGYAGYTMNYRSALDTPYAEKNITQHQVLSTLHFMVGGMIPIRVNSFIRRGNSSIFRDITDVQVAFDAAAYRQKLAALLRERMLRQAPGPGTPAPQMEGGKKGAADMLVNWLRDPLTKQKLIEANEVLRVPGLTADPHAPDTVNKKREDSLRREAGLLLDAYAKGHSASDSLNGIVDSLKRVYDASVGRALQYRQAAKGGFNSPASYDQWKNQLQETAPGAGSDLSGGQKWLLGVRSLGVGKNNINTSELTAKNLSLNGVHFEYNSWYFLGVSAGLVDYRFRDFVVHRLKEPRQYMYMLRAGLGRLEKNYFILSVFGGQKQLLTSVNPSGMTPTVRMTGLGAETKWQVERNTFVVAEAAQSFSPAMPGSELPVKSGWDLGDKSNKALSVKFSSWVPATTTRLEAQYKFTGANYQSFNSFQTNSELRAWYVKGEQNFFHRQVKLVASLRSNDFSNPYIIQNYSSNTVFKSVGLTLHRKGLPILTAGYMPMSQLTMVGNQLSESRFQTLNAGISHFYKLGLRQASTNIVYTRFFNSSADSGFIYYNSVNLYAGQTIFFRDFTATLALSYSKSQGYQYNVLEGNVSIPLSGAASVGVAAKLNELNQAYTGVGGFADVNLAISPRDKLSLRWEKGYLPGSSAAARLVPNVIGSISYMKIFK